MAQIEHNIIDALKSQGQYLSTTSNLAEDTVNNTAVGYSSEELSPGLRNQVIEYLIDGSKKSKKAANDISKYPVDSEEYKSTIEEQNRIRMGFENVKNDLGYWANFKVANFNSIQNHSRLADFYKKEFASRLVADENSIDSTAVISDDGLAFNLNGEMVSVKDINLPEPANTADVAAIPLRDLAEQQANERKFNENNVEGDIREIIDGLQKQGGWKSLKSLAGDYKFNNGTDYNTFIDWIAEKEGGVSTKFKENLDISIADNPETPTDDLEKLNKDAYEVGISYIWNSGNNNSMKEKMVGYFIDVMKNSYKEAHAENVSVASENIGGNVHKIEGEIRSTLEKLHKSEVSPEVHVLEKEMSGSLDKLHSLVSESTSEMASEAVETKLTPQQLIEKYSK